MACASRLELTDVHNLLACVGSPHAPKPEPPEPQPTGGPPVLFLCALFLLLGMALMLAIQRCTGQNARFTKRWATKLQDEPAKPTPAVGGTRGDL